MKDVRAVLHTGKKRFAVHNIALHERDVLVGQSIAIACGARERVNRMSPADQFVDELSTDKTGCSGDKNSCWLHVLFPGGKITALQKFKTVGKVEKNSARDNEEL